MNNLINELKRRHVFKAALSYIVVAWVFLQAAAIIFPLLNLSPGVLRGCLVLLAVGFPFWMVFAYFFDITSDGIVKTEKLPDGAPSQPVSDRRSYVLIIGGLSLAVILLIADRAFNFTGIGSGDGKTKTIAVLPFQNLSPGDENDFFATGVHEDVMNTLASLGTVRVICRTSVNKYRDYEGDLREVGQRLGADYLMEGSVRRSEDQVRITAQLIDAATNQMIWSDTYDRKLENILELQSAIARQIAAKMEAGISAEEDKRLASAKTVHIEAYDSYLRARGMMNESWVPYDKLMTAIGYLEKSVELDPSFPESWALLSYAQSDRYYMVSQFDGREDEAAEAKREAATALEKTRELDPQGLEYYRALAVYEFEVNGDKVATIRNLDKALAIQPDDSDALFLISYLQFQMGELQESMANMERSYELDPENGRTAYYLTLCYEMLREYEKMVPFLKKLLMLEPEKTHYGVQAKYYQFLADGKLESFRAFEEAVRTVEKTEQCDDRAIQDNEMVVAMFNGDLNEYTESLLGKWDQHHRGHGNWSCPMILNEEANHAKLLLQHSGDHELAHTIIDEARQSSTRPIDENSMCIFNKAVFEPKLDIMEGDTAAARRNFENVVFDVIQNEKFPRGAVEKVVLLQTADQVAPERVYSIYRQVTEAKVSLVGMESVCANPWIYPNLVRDPRFLEEVRADGRFVAFLEHYGFMEG